MQFCTKYCTLSTADGMSALIKHIQGTYNLDLKSVGIGSLEIKFQYPSLERIEDSIDLVTLMTLLRDTMCLSRGQKCANL